MGLLYVKEMTLSGFEKEYDTTLKDYDIGKYVVVHNHFLPGLSTFSVYEVLDEAIKEAYVNPYFSRPIIKIVSTRN